MFICRDLIVHKQGIRFLAAGSLCSHEPLCKHNELCDAISFPGHDANLARIHPRTTLLKQQCRIKSAIPYMFHSSELKQLIIIVVARGIGD